MESIEIGNDCFGIVSEFTLSNLTSLQSIEIGDDCFVNVKTFKIDGLDRLQTLQIGGESFTNGEDWNKDDKSKSFHILNCASLESIQIGRYSFRYFGDFELRNLPQLQSIQIGEDSFSDYAGEFELRNLPQLQSIQIGVIGAESNNFRYSSFVIRGIELILNIVMFRSSKSTIHYIR